MHGPLSADELTILRRLPAISRAREHRLYTFDGERWVDCWADGGRGLEGHRPGGLSKRIKNEVDRGLYAPYPGRWESRFEKALMKTFPGYRSLRLFRNTESALMVLGLDSPPVDPLDLPAASLETRTPGSPVSQDAPCVSGVFWGRPLLPLHPVGDVLLPIMPVSGLTEVQPVLFRDDPGPKVSSELVSPIVLAALTRSLLPGSRAGEIPESPKTVSGSAQSKGKLPFRGESTDIWERRGPYMLFTGTESEYTALFETLFAQKILIAPSFRRPSVFPVNPSPREAELILGGGFRK